MFEPRDEPLRAFCTIAAFAFVGTAARIAAVSECRAGNWKAGRIPEGKRNCSRPYGRD